MSTSHELNFRGKVLSVFGRLCGGRRFQGIMDKLQALSLSAMNVGGATLDYIESGEVAVMNSIRNSREPDHEWVIFDVGAHKGDYAKALREVFGQQARILCFEPSKHLFTALAKRSDLNCEMFDVALSDEEEELSLFAAENEIPSILSSAFDITGQSIVSEERIKSVRFDDFCANHSVDRVDFVKIDVEGYELKVLKGLGAWLTNATIDFIQFEFGPHAIASRTYFHDFYELLAPHYRLHRVLRNGLVDLGQYRPRYEQYTSATNYLAVSRTRASAL